MHSLNIYVHECKAVGSLDDELHDLVLLKSKVELAVTSDEAFHVTKFTVRHDHNQLLLLPVVEAMIGAN